MKTFRPFLIIAIVLVVAVIGGVVFLRSRQSTDSSRSSQPPSNVPTETAKKLPADTVVTLEEFGDYQCPPCGELHPTLKKLKAEFGPNLNFIFRNYPLSEIHKNALLAAQAAEAARVQNRFWEMHDLLYESQKVWSDDINPKPIFIKFARDLGLDAEQFVRDLDSQEVKLRIEADREAAAKLGVNGTPTVFINGRRLRDTTTTPDGVRRGIELMLARKSQPSP
jgi:protein-disulfide isomerase